ncbi:MAG: TlpA disulfide reductase family protein [Planctomycetota bacterium]|jgi:tetratricopeptide (TPR) repeat protein
MSHPLRAICATALAAVFLLGSPVRADELRNAKLGDRIPDLQLPTISGGRISRADLEGKVVILVFLSAKQRSSESAAASASAVYRDLQRDDLALLFVTADTAHTAYFREHRDQTNQHEPLGLDFERALYGHLGLIVLPTTIVIDKEWKLARVISSYKSDYEHVLTTYAQHTLGLLDDDQLNRQLEAEAFRRDRPSDKIARHRAAARILWRSGMLADVENELRAALDIDPRHADTRLDLAALCLARGQVAEAGEIVDDVLTANPRHRRGKLMNGVVLYRADKLDEAEAALREALVLNPDPAQTHYYLGLVYEKKGDTARALEHYRQSLVRLMEDRPL